MSVRTRAALLFLLIFASSIASAAPPRVDVRLRPIAESGEIVRVEVAERVAGVSAKAGETLFVVPARVTFIPGQPYVDGDVVAEDEAGPLTLAVSVAPDVPGAPLQMRTFSAARDVVGEVRLRYRADVAPALGPRRRGPSYDLRGIGGGFGGAFFSFLLLPRYELGAVDFHLTWELHAAPAGSRGVSVLGEGDVAATLDPQALNTLFFLGGRVEGRPAPGSPFRMYWIGRPPFNANAAADWSARSFEALQLFFREPDNGAYTLLMRPFARPRDGGGATRGGFMLEYGRGELGDVARRIMFTHEMVHHFVGGLTGMSSEHAWYGEGLAEFYKVRVPLRAGLLDLADAEKEIGVMTNAYYTSAVTTTPYAEVAAQRWAGGDAQGVPYNRGFMYFVAVDAAIRAKSGGRRSLDDLVLAMLARRRSGAGYDAAAWQALVTRELGARGRAQYEALRSGKLIVPPADALGSCFTRTESRHRRPVLGLSEDSFLIEPRRVTELQPDSAAARAGLADGDEILAFSGVTPRIAHSARNVRIDSIVAIRARRAGREFDATFSTDGPVVPEYTWTLASPLPQHCAMRHAATRPAQ